MDTDDLKITCYNCPTLVEGKTPDGREVYLRYRWGQATVRIDGERVWSAEIGDSYDGSLDPELARRIAVAVADCDEVDLTDAVRQARRDARS